MRKTGVENITIVGIFINKEQKILKEYAKFIVITIFLFPRRFEIILTALPIIKKLLFAINFRLLC